MSGISLLLKFASINLHSDIVLGAKMVQHEFQIGKKRGGGRLFYIMLGKRLGSSSPQLLACGDVGTSSASASSPMWSHRHTRWWRNIRCKANFLLTLLEIKITPTRVASVRKGDMWTRRNLDKALYLCRRARSWYFKTRRPKDPPLFIPNTGDVPAPFPLVRSGRTFFPVG